MRKWFAGGRIYEGFIETGQGIREKINSNLRLTSPSDEWVSQWLLEDKVAANLILQQFRVCIAKGYSVYGNPSKLQDEIQSDPVVAEIINQIEECEMNYFNQHFLEE